MYKSTLRPSTNLSGFALSTSGAFRLTPVWAWAHVMGLLLILVQLPKSISLSSYESPQRAMAMLSFLTSLWQ